MTAVARGRCCLRYDLTIDDWGKDSHANKVRVGDGLVED